MTQICNRLYTTSKAYRGDFIIINNDLNPFLINLGKLIMLEEEEITDADMYATQIAQGNSISYENDVKLYTWYLELVNEDCFNSLQYLYISKLHFLYRFLMFLPYYINY